MQPRHQLVRILHGSHLYGTNTADSDLDYKGVHVPSGKSILMQNVRDVIDDSVVDKDEANKNTADAVDSQSYSVQKFFQLITLGDMTATEMLFAPDNRVETDNKMLWAVLREQGRSLINRDVRGFVGYCRRQAAKYGIRGSRVAAVEGLRAILDQAMVEGYGHVPLSFIEKEIRAYAEATPHTAIEGIAGGDKSKKMPHIVCCDRKMPFTAHISKVFEVYDKIWQEYGHRARQAANNEGIDWKAISHAMRVANQAYELLTEHRITFPSPEAELLTKIKLGQLSYDEVSVVLEERIAQVEAVESTLPKKSDMELMRSYVLDYHFAQVQ